MQLELYKNSYQLKENEYLLKTQKPYRGATLTGFITKFNKDGSIPVAFKDWGKKYPAYETPETYIMKRFIEVVGDYLVGGSVKVKIGQH